MKNKILIVLLFILSIISTYSCFLVYKSMEEQMIFLSEFNSNKFNTNLKIIGNFNHTYPNISVTTIPLSQMKANYFSKEKEFDKALKLIREGYNTNPYLGFGDFLLSRIHKEKGSLDSSKYYATKAIEKLPNNPIHINNFYQTIDNFEIADEIFNKYSSFDNPYFWLGYINYSINNPKMTKQKLIQLNDYALDNFNIELENFKKIDSYLKSGGINNYYQQIIKGALESFNNKKYNESIEKFKQAIEIQPNDYSNYENLSLIYFNLNNFEESLRNINIVLERFNTNNGKAEMLKGMALIGLGDNILACEYFKSSINKGMNDSQALLNKYCN